MKPYVLFMTFCALILIGVMGTSYYVHVQYSRTMKAINKLNSTYSQFNKDIQNTVVNKYPDREKEKTSETNLDPVNLQCRLNNKQIFLGKVVEGKLSRDKRVLTIVTEDNLKITHVVGINDHLHCVRLPPQLE